MAFYMGLVFCIAIVTRKAGSMEIGRYQKKSFEKKGRITKSPLKK